jgi:hypothetical protein
MSMRSLAALILLIVLAAANLSAANLSARDAKILRPEGDHFELNGKPLQIISGAIHTARIPRAYWRDRLRKARAMGLNTVETYVFWNVYEATPGNYDFSGQNDIAEFIREAQQEGLYVILRPGPYACAEWDFGGLPAWLLRSQDRSPPQRPRVHRRGFTLASSSRQGAGSTAKRQWRTHHRRAGRKRIRIVRIRPCVHGTNPSPASRRRLRSRHAVHRRRRGRA